MFGWLEEHVFLINVAKSVFGVPELDILGYHLDHTGIRPLQEKVQVIREVSHPERQRQLRTFIGLVNFYHRFIPNGAAILHPLHSLLNQTQHPSDELTWTESTTAAFENVKNALANASLLVHSTPDAPTSIMTNASDVAVGAVLQQYIKEQWCPLAFFSRTLKYIRS